MAKITVIIPCYFNEQNIPVTTQKLLENELLFEPQTQFEYLLVDDGSKDQTWTEIVKFQQAHPHKVKVIKLVRNFSSTSAVLAALHYSTGDCNVVIAADLQDPPELIPQMFKQWQMGYKMVVANRTNREEPVLQKFTSNLVHLFTKKWALAKLPSGGFDLCLFDREIKDKLVQMNPRNSYLPYLLVWLGYDFAVIPYVRRKREIGKSGYTLSKKIKLFTDAFVSFARGPVRFIATTGVFTGTLAFILGFIIMVAKLTGVLPTHNEAGVLAVLLFFCSLQMIALGLIVRRGLDASSDKPNFLIESMISD